MAFNGPLVFLAGGISNCPNWQEELTQILKHEPDDLGLLINPRRIGDLAQNGSEAAEQIAWEHRAIKNTDLMTFWFPKETLCPITLFEYGIALAQKYEIVLGIHPEYQRRFDLETQTKLYNPLIKPVYSLEALAKQIVNKLQSI